MTTIVSEQATSVAEACAALARRRKRRRRRQIAVTALAVLMGLGLVVRLVQYIAYPRDGYYECLNDSARGPQSYPATLSHGDVVDLPRAYKSAYPIQETFGSQTFKVTFVELGKYVGHGAADRNVTFTCTPMFPDD